jgi:hypothetical protein
MKTEDVKKGMSVAWGLNDGNVMAGTVEEVLTSDYATVKRVDGGFCTLRIHSLRSATHGNLWDAMRFYDKNTPPCPEGWENIDINTGERRE